MNEKHNSVFNAKNILKYLKFYQNDDKLLIERIEDHSNNIYMCKDSIINCLNDIVNNEMINSNDSIIEKKYYMSSGGVKMKIIISEDIWSLISLYNLIDNKEGEDLIYDNKKI